MEKNVFGNKIEWVWLMKKIASPFAISCIPQGMLHGKKAFQYPQHLTAQWYDHANVYCDKEEINLIKKLIRYQIIQDRYYPQKIAENALLVTKKIQEYNLSEDILKKRSVQELIVQLKKDLSLFFDILGYMSYRGSVKMAEVLGEKVEAIIVHKLAEQNKLPCFQDTMHLLNIPSQPSIMTEEKSYMLKKAEGFDLIPREEKDKIIREYIQKYQCLSYHWFLGKPLQQEEVRMRLLVYSKNAKEEFQELMKIQQELQENVQKIIKEYKFTIQEQEVLKQYQTWIFLRTYVKDHINLLAYKMLPLLHLIGEKKGLPKEDMPYLTLEEIERIEDSDLGELRKKMGERKKGFSAGAMEMVFFFQDFKKPQE